MIELSDFVKQTLVDIVNGVQEAAKEINGKSRAIVNPTLSHANHSDLTLISFDIGVTVE